MQRGICHRCSLSSMLFILVVEILATVLRKDNHIVGITVGNKEHRIVQFADDLTIIVGNLNSIKHVLDIIHRYTKFAGPKLNMS